MPNASDLVAKLGEKASGECPPCKDGPCAMQPCGYHCNYPYTDDSTMWAENCPACRERREAHKRLEALAVNSLPLLLKALEKADKLAVHRRRCMAGGGSCPGECELALELYAEAEASRAEALATVRDAAKEALP